MSEELLDAPEGGTVKLRKPYLVNLTRVLYLANIIGSVFVLFVIYDILITEDKITDGGPFVAFFMLMLGMFTVGYSIFYIRYWQKASQDYMENGNTKILENELYEFKNMLHLIGAFITNIVFIGILFIVLLESSLSAVSSFGEAVYIYLVILFFVGPIQLVFTYHTSKLRKKVLLQNK